MDNEFKQEVRLKFGEFDKRFESIDKRFDSVDARFDALEARMDASDRKFDNFRNEVREKFNQYDEILASLQKSVLIIEDYVTNKIPALFDAYSLNQEQHHSFDEKIDSLENLTSNHSLKISVLEDTSKTHSEQLAKLTS